MLSISGGGTRAVGFHLGTLAYLDRLGLLPDVGALSSVSGGSFVGTTYALALKQGKSFTEYFAWVYRAIGEAEMVEWCLNDLARGTPRCASRRRSLVTSLAEMYDRHFFKGARFETFWHDEPVSHLEGRRDLRRELPGAPRPRRRHGSRVGGHLHDSDPRPGVHGPLRQPTVPAPHRRQCDL